MSKKYFLIFPLVITSFVFSQEEAASADVEEVVVVGSQIKGAKITGALPVSVITSDDIDALGIDSGDELLDNIAELGQNTFNQNEFSGGYNASRGDVGAFNLRDIGTGNTLALINGRRIITSPGYQTEPIFGGSMPVFTVNSNSIPVYGAERVEILRDGASAIYGADALAGVVNTVLKSDFVGLNVRFKASAYDAYEAQDNKVSIQWGKDFGDTNVSVYFDRYDRDKIAASEDPKWAINDNRIAPGLHPDIDGSPWDDISWRSTHQASRYGIWWNGGNRFTTIPTSDPKCTSTAAADVYTGTGGDTCLIDYYSSSSSFWDKYRANYSDTRWMRPELERNNLFVFVNTTLDNGIEAYSEIGIYNSLASQQIFPGTTLGYGSCGEGGNCTQPYLIPKSNYWLQQLYRTVDGEKEYFVDSENVGDGLWKFSHRFDTPRAYDSHRTTIRLLQGFRGSIGNWDWDGAILYSDAKSKQNNTGRQSMTLLDQALALNTPEAYNPFCGGNGCSDESAFTIDIIRANTTGLKMADIKFSNSNVYDLPAGPVAMLVGFEVREEDFTDGRDPRIMGDIKYTVPVGPKAGLTYPLISDVVNSSATPESSGSRRTTSYFTELAIPVMDNIDMQIAVRGEDSDDYGDNLVSKLALGWQIIDQVKFRYSFSETFRAPSLILINEGFLGRSSSQSDGLFEYVSGVNLNGYSMQRVTEGNPDLKPETGENESIGFVLEPIENLIITLDKWSIETENTVGVFGMFNATLLDTLIRINGGANECIGNPNVIRSSNVANSEQETTLDWASKGLCPAGIVERVNDFYVNADKRTIEGLDTSIIYDIDTDYGKFGFKFVHAHYDTYNQEPSGDALLISDAAEEGGPLASVADPRGLANLLGENGRIEDKYTLKTSWRKGPYEVLLSGTRWGDFQETGHTETINGVKETWRVASMRMVNLTLGYKFDNDMRVRLQVKNIEDTRAPLADESYGAFWADLHTDFGRNYNIEIYKKF
jgi:iron complex outermembrane receptor protein